MGSRKRGPSRCRAALLRHASEGCGCGARACAACEAGAMRRGSRESEYGIRLGVRCVCVCVHEAPPGVKACSFHGWCEDRVRSAREADARMGCMGWYRHPHRDSSSARDAVNRTQPAIPPAGNHRRRPDQPGPAVGRIRRPYGGGDLVSRRLLRRPPTIAQLPPAIMMLSCKRCRGMCAATTLCKTQSTPSSS